MFCLVLFFPTVAVDSSLLRWFFFFFHFWTGTGKKNNDGAKAQGNYIEASRNSGGLVDSQPVAGTADGLCLVLLAIPLHLGHLLSWIWSQGEMKIALILWLPGGSYCLAAIWDYLKTPETDLGEWGEVAYLKHCFYIFREINVSFAQ